MKFLADVNVERRVVELFRSQGFEVMWIPDFDCSMTDEELLAIAKSQNRILITNDKDFGELTFRQHKTSAGIILLRIAGEHIDKKLEMIRILLEQHVAKLSNQFTIVSDHKFRFIDLEETYD